MKSNPTSMKLLIQNNLSFLTISLGLWLIFSCQMEVDDPSITVKRLPENGQYVFIEQGDTVLQYNYHTVYEENVIRLAEAKAENYNRRERDTFVTTELYAVPRSNYIHPLYGINGEMLTRDWPAGAHPHHRGIFWAWPEVYYGSKLGDIYALQTVFARPTGKILLKNNDYAQLQAENIWRWNDREAIVHELAVIKVHKKKDNHRFIDLAFRLTALKDSITIATRNTDSYGGLNIRMQTPDKQEIQYHSDTAAEENQRAWSNFSGIFENVKQRSGLVVLQHPSNPQYPGAWVEYPDLSWVQPTFPAQGTRFLLKKTVPLELKYRMVVYEGDLTESNLCQDWWDEYQQDLSTQNIFEE